MRVNNAFPCKNDFSFSINAILTLAPGSFGVMPANDIVHSGEIIRLSNEVIGPFYRQKMEKALAGVEEYFAGLNYKVHVPEGAMFLWMWFQDLPVSSRELYERLKARKVLVVSGDYFFPGLEEGWRHTGECIRITNLFPGRRGCSAGTAAYCDEVKKIYNQAK